jgi:L-lactate dehydrogenase complex protein LldE
MKIAVMGSGGVGGYFGARLAQGGCDVAFIARGAHFAAMREHGLTVESPLGDISARIADNKCANALATGAAAVVLGDLGCMLNIEGRLRRRGDTKTKVLHVAEVLAGATPDS